MSNESKKAFLDHESDPAHTPGDGWVDEGGASHLGPATHLSSRLDGAHGKAVVEEGNGEEDNDEE